MRINNTTFVLLVKHHGFYNRAQAKGETAKHSSMRVYIHLPETHLQRIRQVYEDLTSDELLKRCLRGKTQNPNEFLHSKIWSKCNKIKFFGFDRVKFVAQISILDHNFGYKDASLMKALGFCQTYESAESLDHQDKARLNPEKCKRTRPNNVTLSSDYNAGSF